MSSLDAAQRNQGRRVLRIGIVAGEASGDRLGADLIRALKTAHPNIHIEGIAGPRMQAEGAHTLFPMERLSVMGLVEVLAHIPTLLRIRRHLIRHFLANPPDVFIGIDSPDFNLDLELKLRRAGIKTVQYVSPQVWAWRRRRVHKIARAVDKILVLFPFEVEFYRRHRVPCECVGHPLADSTPLQPDRKAAREALNLSENATIIALLPGSRKSEITRLGKIFIQTAQWCLQQRSDLRFVAPLVSEAQRAQFQAMLNEIAPDLPITLLIGRSQSAITTSDVVLTVSGTAAFETMLLKRPMVVAYKMSPLSYCIAREMVRLHHFSLPNLLTGKPLVPEFLQGGVKAERLGRALLNWLDEPESRDRLITAFDEVHRTLRQGASERAARAVLDI